MNRSSAEVCDNIELVRNSSALHVNLWKKGLGSVRIPSGEVSDQIGRLKKLRMLDLGHNELTRVPDDLAKLDNLTDFLYLHDNRLSSLPSSLKNLTKLR